jgi:hypothetical protein
LRALPIIDQIIELFRTTAFIGSLVRWFEVFGHGTICLAFGSPNCGDPSLRAIGDDSDRVVLEMRVPIDRARLATTARIFPAR